MVSLVVQVVSHLFASHYFDEIYDRTLLTREISLSQNVISGRQQGSILEILDRTLLHSAENNFCDRILWNMLFWEMEFSL